MSLAVLPSSGVGTLLVVFFSGQQNCDCFSHVYKISRINLVSVLEEDCCFVSKFLVISCPCRIRHVTLAWCTAARTGAPCARSTGR